MQIDMDKYQEGRRNFTEGGSLLALFQRTIDADSGGERTQDGAVSFGLGFLDAALDKLRGVSV